MSSATEARWASDTFGSFPGNHGLNRSKTVSESVILDGLNPFRGSAAGRLEGILAICFHLLVTNRRLLSPR
jgi:hypothetical protein